MRLRAEIRPMLGLAVPVVLAEIGWVSMGIVDTVIVGRLGPAAIGAVGIGAILFQAVAIFGMGLLLGLDTLVSHAYGAGRLDECRAWLVHGLYLSAALAPPLTALAFLGTWLMPAFGLNDEVLGYAVPYLRVITWSLPPLLLYASFRRYLQAVGMVRWVTVALVSANLINAVAAWALVYGHLGAPAMGTTGSGFATLGARLYMAAFLLVGVLRARRGHGPVSPAALRPSRHRLKRLVRLGLPAAGQVTLELGVFAMASALAGRLDAVSLAAHQITLNLASFTFMVPLGLGAAGAVRVGHAVGRGDARGAADAGWTALLLGAAFMAGAATAFVTAPRLLLHLFTPDTPVVELGIRLLQVAAMFQLFDGLQGVATGALRGLGDTRTPMAANLAGHWAFGLPIGYLACFGWGWGVIGLWMGLSAGLIAIGVVLVVAWRRQVGSLIART